MFLIVLAARLQVIFSSLTSSKGVIDTYTRQIDKNLPIDQTNSLIDYVAITMDLTIRILLIVLVVLGIRYLWQLVRHQKSEG